MEPSRTLPKERAPVRIVAISIYIFAVVLDLIRLIFQFQETQVVYYELAVLVFDAVFGIALIVGLLKRNLALIDLMLVILKVYDGTFFILNSLMRIDSGHINTLDRISNYFLIAAGVVSLITFFFFCLHYYFEENKYWKWIIFTVLLTAILLLVSAIISTINFAQGNVGWFYVVEILAMCLQTMAIHFVCRYVQDYE